MPDDEDPSTEEPAAESGGQEPEAQSNPSRGTDLSRFPVPTSEVDFSRLFINTPGYQAMLRSISGITAAQNEAMQQAVRASIPTDAISRITQSPLPTEALARLSEQIREIVRPIDVSGLTASMSVLAKAFENWPTLTDAKDYSEPDPPRSPYSPQMHSPESYFGPYEIEIDSVDDLHREITRLIAKSPDLPLVWRGVRRASWGLHSGLYRRLMDVNGVVPPEDEPGDEQPYPDENQMVAAEREMLRIARDDWRYDDMSALETFARIQHAGGPTRLIDVTFNPYVAAWFAVESNAKDDDQDARLFAIATRPVEKDGAPPAGDSTMRLDELGKLRNPFWHGLGTPAERQSWDWGTGARRRLWKPPAYDPRISVQNAAFILDGVPITSAKLAPYFKIEGSVYWRRADLLASASIYAKLHSPRRAPRYNARNFAPTFSFRITAASKAKIREYLESRFGYGRSYIYPDMAGLAAELKGLPLAEQ